MACKQCGQAIDVSQTAKTVLDTLKLPDLKFCHACAMPWLMSFRNERTFYPNSCKKCNAPLISSYLSGGRYLIYCRDCWWSDTWDGTAYGLDSKDCYMCSLISDKCEHLFYCYWMVNTRNSADCHGCFNDERCYFCMQVADSYDCSYLLQADKCTDCHYGFEATVCGLNTEFQKLTEEAHDLEKRICREF